MQTRYSARDKAFTLIETLVVIVVMFILFGIVFFAAGPARKSARDERRKADLQSISSAVVRFRSDCGDYPSEAYYNGIAAGESLTGDGSTPSCLSNNVYLKQKPKDPNAPDRAYSYSLDASAEDYYLCVALENIPAPAFSESELSNCGSCGSSSCNYIIHKP